MVEDVEDLPAKLNTARLTDSNVLSQGRVESGRGRSQNDVAGRISDSIHSRRRIGEAGRIEPLQKSMRGVSIRIANSIGPSAGRRGT